MQKETAFPWSRHRTWVYTTFVYLYIVQRYTSQVAKSKFFYNFLFITQSSSSRIHKLHYPIIPTTTTTDIDNKQLLIYLSTPQNRATNRLERAQNMTISKKYRKKFGQVIKRLYFCTRKNGITYALLAQLVEQLTLNQWVQGSNPWECTNAFRYT